VTPTVATRGEATGVERVFREVYGQAVATLVRIFGDITLAEDAVQDAFVVASDRWHSGGIPPNPAGWIVTTARNRAIDDLRRSARGRGLHEQVGALATTPQGPGPEEWGEDGPVRDDQLRLIFTCCHPALRTEHHLALTLRLLGGLSVEEVARSFLVSEAAMAKRLVRAKYKIKAAKIPYRVPKKPTCLSDSGRSCRCCTSSTTPGSTVRTGPRCGARRFGSLARSSSCCPMSPKRQGCSR
jgi:RNA polymerase sigma-70 factor (ECF subfamily)